MSIDPVQVSIRDQSIRLGQLLKLAGVVEDGGQARELIQAGAVLVDGQVETRRARAVPVGAIVQLGDQRIKVTNC